MKKIIMFLVVIYFAIIPIRAYADGASVEVNIEGQVRKGESIDILVNVKNVERFYAASVDFIYDTELLKVDSIQATDFITKHSNDIMELGGEVDKNGNTATYSFTFIGDKPGISDSGNLVIIKATVLSDEKLVVSEENMEVRLVQRNGDTVENYPFTFVGYSIEDNNTGVIVKPEEGVINTPNQPNNNNLENNNEAIDKDEEINKVVDSENNKSNSDNNNEKSEDNLLNNTNKDEPIVKDSNLKSKNNSMVYVIIGLVVLVGLSFGGYKVYKDKCKK